MLPAQTSVTTDGAEHEHEPKPVDTPALFAATRIPRLHLRKLRWFFSNPPLAGVGRNGGTFGRELDRAWLFGFQTYPCARCNGNVWSNRPGTGRCPRRHKDLNPTGRSSYRSVLRRFRIAEAKRMGVRLVAEEAVDGWRELGVPAVSAEWIAVELPPELTQWCRWCRGSGMLERKPRRNGPITAQPILKNQPRGRSGATGLDEEMDLERYGLLSRALQRVTDRSELARSALELYCAPENRAGMAALWPLTQAGPLFLRSLDNPRELSPSALLAEVRAAQAKDPDPDWSLALGAIARETAGIWDYTGAVWNVVVAGAPDLAAELDLDWDEEDEA